MIHSAEMSLTHLDRMTDSTGLIQHAIYGIPRRESGYTTDDNARALRLCTRLWGHQPDERMLDRIACYLSFLEHARCPVKGFHNFLGYQRDWLDTTGTGDCQGQAVLALAEVLGSRLPESFRAVAEELIETVLPMLAELRSLRAQAYVILAWSHLRKADIPLVRGLEVVAEQAALRLTDAYQRSHRPKWPWFESRMTYANAVLPHSLFAAAERWPNGPFLEVAEATFGFLVGETTTDGLFWPVGNLDWYARGESKSPYDQQPVEASTMAEAALAAGMVRVDGGHRVTFLRAHAWFEGHNSLGLPLLDPLTGGCYDGLQAEGLNLNQGAESTLAALWTRWLGIATRITSCSDDELSFVGHPSSRSAQENPHHDAARKATALS